MYKQITAAALFAAGVSAHGRVTSPTPRPLGAAMKAACGDQVWNMQSSDNNGNIQTMAQIGTSQSDFDAAKCHLWQCRGYQFDDATDASVQSFTPGQKVPFVVDIAAPHSGVANVSVVDLGANAVIGDALISWDSYASTERGVQPGDENFSVTIPTDLPETCSQKGGCAIQWWWDARSIDQTYMSCVDFVVAGASGSSAPAPAPEAPAASAPAASAPAPAPAASSAAPTTSVAANAAAAAPTEAADDNASACSKRKTRRAFRA
ncbi:hypothetical protein KVR01_013652 [Diaporthe batatas]|uniref:uncharacterized protein n=1 Tax=Diaporthe batatas TaxID=748121 RepID=UPI001D0472CF|nr:uncharacterized protein KVR01_013652 [Diaporthe batatas]KAG8156548.1 hypothetical protein KVR01_013652 [Diaporthe batatas]